MGLFDYKKIKALREEVNELIADRSMLMDKIQHLSREVHDLWAVNDYHEKVIKSIPSVKHCMSCANFKADKKGFPVCDCGNTIFEINNNCPYTPR